MLNLRRLTTDQIQCYRYGICIGARDGTVSYPFRKWELGRAIKLTDCAWSQGWGAICCGAGGVDIINRKIKAQSIYRAGIGYINRRWWGAGHII